MASTHSIKIYVPKTPPTPCDECECVCVLDGVKTLDMDEPNNEQGDSMSRKEKVYLYPCYSQFTK